MPSLAVSAVGADRPGIVARVTGALADAGCNLEDTRMALLRGEFVMMLVVAAPDGTTAAAVQAAVERATADLDLVVVVREVDPPAAPAAAGPAWTVAVYGADHPGIVHGIAAALAERGVNVTDVTTRLADGDRVYAMVMEVTVPEGMAGDDLGEVLAPVARRLGVEVSAHRSDADIL